MFGKASHEVRPDAGMLWGRMDADQSVSNIPPKEYIGLVGSLPSGPSDRGTPYRPSHHCPKF